MFETQALCLAVWGIIRIAAQDALAATLVNDAPHLIHCTKGPEPRLADLLLDAGESPPVSRLPGR